MRSNLVFLLAAGLISFTVNAGESDAPPAFPITISIDSGVSPNMSDQLPDIVRSALSVVQMFPPEGYENNLFHWSADRGILANKQFNFFLATSKNPSIAPLFTGTLGMDALTLAPMNKTKMTMNILLVVLVDRIFYDSDGRELPNGFAKLVVALAHEIYGNVQHFLEFDMADAQPQTMASRIAQQRAAARASLLFLGGLSSNKLFASLPSKTGEDLLALRRAEVSAYRSWLNAHPTAERDPACEAMLAMIQNQNGNTKPQ